MKLLFDENISYRIVKKIEESFPNSLHVSRMGLKSPISDINIWNYSKQNNYTIVTFDEDFEDLANLYGFPPKVILLRFGNASTQTILDILTNKLSDIGYFIESEFYGILEIF